MLAVLVGIVRVRSTKATAIELSLKQEITTQTATSLTPKHATLVDSVCIATRRWVLDANAQPRLNALFTNSAACRATSSFARNGFRTLSWVKLTNPLKVEGAGVGCLVGGDRETAGISRNEGFGHSNGKGAGCIVHNGVEVVGPTAVRLASSEDPEVADHLAAFWGETAVTAGLARGQ